MVEKAYEFEVYKDEANEWRFRILASNGRIVADSGEGYKTKYFCEKNIGKLKKKLTTAEIRYV